jgi:hypothetical protein
VEHRVVPHGTGDDPVAPNPGRRQRTDHRGARLLGSAAQVFFPGAVWREVIPVVAAPIVGAVVKGAGRIFNYVAALITSLTDPSPLLTA